MVNFVRRLSHDANSPTQHMAAQHMGKMLRRKREKEIGVLSNLQICWTKLNLRLTNRTRDMYAHNRDTEVFGYANLENCLSFLHSSTFSFLGGAQDS